MLTREKTKIALVAGDGRVFANDLAQIWVVKRDKLPQTLENLAPAQRKAIITGLKYSTDGDRYSPVSIMVVTGKDSSLDHKGAIAAFCEAGELDVITCFMPREMVMAYFVLSD